VALLRSEEDAVAVVLEGETRHMYIRHHEENAQAVVYNDLRVPWPFVHQFLKARATCGWLLSIAWNRWQKPWLWMFSMERSHRFTAFSAREMFVYGKNSIMWIYEEKYRAW